MTNVPRLSVGLPVYNGAKYLSEALDSLLGQSYTDFELIISDNGSEDETGALCRRYMDADTRIRYIRQDSNIGATANHNFTFTQARGKLFKWAAHDDLYDRDLLLRCVQEFDRDPNVVLSHAGCAVIYGDGDIAQTLPYRINSRSLHPPERFRSLLFDTGGQDFYGVIRSDVLRKTPLLRSFHLIPERALIAEISLHGPFSHVPVDLMYRRQHPSRGGVQVTKRAHYTTLDPNRSDRLRNPIIRLQTEYAWAFFAAVDRAPISGRDKIKCYRELTRYLSARIRPAAFRKLAYFRPLAGEHASDLDLDTSVPGRKESRPT